MTWAEVAAWSGQGVHSRVQFDAIATPAAGAGGPAAPWQGAPEPGTLPPSLLSALCGILAVHTGTPDHCWFAVWDGYSRPPGPHAAVASCALRSAADAPAGPRVLPPRFPPGVIRLPEVLLPERPYLLLEGPLDASGELGMTLYDQSPSLFWPDDHAWLVATDVDLDSTYLGGCAALVRDLLADGHLEAVPVSVADPVWADSDDVGQAGVVAQQAGLRRVPRWEGDDGNRLAQTPVVMFTVPRAVSSPSQAMWMVTSSTCRAAGNCSLSRGTKAIRPALPPLMSMRNPSLFPVVTRWTSGMRTVFVPCPV